MPLRASLLGLVFVTLTFSLTGFCSLNTHTHDSHRWPVARGIITNLGAKFIRVQEEYSSIRLKIVTSTRVVRYVDGSLTDLRPGETVDVHEANGIVYAITIELPPPPNRPSTTGTSKTPKNGNGPLGGAIQSITATTIAITSPAGKPLTLQLAPDVRITKQILGSYADLAIGEYVRAYFDFHLRALTISILNA